jgi:DNA-binding LytR/AlgR family response regulator
MERLAPPFTTEEESGRGRHDHALNLLSGPAGIYESTLPTTMENPSRTPPLPFRNDQGSSGGNLVREFVRIAIKVNGRILFIDPADVVAVKAEGNYVSLQHKTGSYLVRDSMATVEEKLRPYGFVRIHRTILVNSAFVVELKKTSARTYSVSLKGGFEYPVGQTHRGNLKAIAKSWLGVEI